MRRTNMSAKDMADHTIVELLDYLVRLAEMEHRTDMAAIVQDAHDKCLDLFATRILDHKPM